MKTGAVIDFATCANAAADAAVKARIDEAVGKILAAFGTGALRSIILTGAMTQGEGTALQLGGRVTVLSDLDFYLVAAPGVPLEPMKRKASELARGLRAAVAEADLASSFDLAAVSLEEIASAAPSIGTVDLRNRGRVLWGEDVLSDLAPLDPARIPARDAVTLLFNRIAEEMLYRPGARGAGEAMAIYHTMKTGADLALSILVLLGEYRPSYRERAERLGEVWDGAALEWLRGRVPDLPGRVRTWTEYKLAPSPALVREEAGPGPEEALAERLWLSLMPYVRAVWAWALGRWMGVAEDEPLVLAGRIGAMDTARERLRGWKWSWRRGEVGRRPADLWRMAVGMTRGSPRSLLYAAASLVYFAGPEANGLGAHAARRAAYLDQARRLMPVPPGAQRDSDWESLRRTLVEHWRRSVMRGMR